jgi:hypothetical protein
VVTDRFFNQLGMLVVATFSGFSRAVHITGKTQMAACLYSNSPNKSALSQNGGNTVDAAMAKQRTPSRLLEQARLRQADGQTVIAMPRRAVTAFVPSLATANPRRASLSTSSTPADSRVE